MNDLPVALSIAGSDSGGGAGVQADLLTFAANGVFGTTAITCLTAQNPGGVVGVNAVAPEFVVAQAKQVFDFFAVKAVKTGMLFDTPIIAAVAELLQGRHDLPIVVDPVMVATSGAALLKPEAVTAVCEKLLPLAALVTPNLDEAAVLLGYRPEDSASMRVGALDLARRFGAPFLVKGGHLGGDELVDVLAMPDGTSERWIGRRIEGVDTHGSGCTLSSAIAAHLARGTPLVDAVAAGRAYLRQGMELGVAVSGRRFIAHLV